MNNMRRTTSNNRTRRVKSPGFVTYRAMNGGPKNLVGNAPAQFTARPYYALTLNLVNANASEEYYYTNQDVINGIVAQLGLNAGDASTISVKLQSVESWAVPTASSADRPSVEMEVSSLIPQVEDTTTAPVAISYPILKVLQDTGTLSEAAKVGFTWPLAMRDMPLGNTANHVVFASSGNVAFTTIRCHLLWSTSGEAVPPALRRAKNA